MDEPFRSLIFIVHVQCALCFQLPAEEKVTGSCCRGPFRTHGVGFEPNDLFGLAAVASGCSCPRARGTSVLGPDLC